MAYKTGAKTVIRTGKGGLRSKVRPEGPGVRQMCDLICSVLVTFRDSDNLSQLWRTSATLFRIRTMKIG